MKKICKNFFQCLDIYKMPMNVMFYSKEKISTNFNIMLSILFYCTLLTAFFQSDFFKKKHPKISDQVYDNKKASIELNEKNFGLNLWLYDDEDYIREIDNSYIFLNVTQMTYNYHIDEYDKKNYTLEPCQDPKYIDGFCIQNEEKIHLALSEETWNGEYNYLKIVLLLCNNQTFNNQCKSLEEIKDYVDGKYFAVGFYQYLVDAANYNDPISVDDQNFHEFTINKNFHQIYQISFMEAQLYHDENLLVDDGGEAIHTFYQIDSYPNFNFYEVSSDDEEIHNDELINFLIYPSRNKRIVKRKYISLIEALSNLGGLATFLNFFGVIISKISINAKIIRKVAKNLNKRENEDNKKENEVINKNKCENNIAKEHEKIEIKDSLFHNSVEMSLRNKNDIEMEKLEINSRNAIQCQNKSHPDQFKNKKESVYEKGHQLNINTVERIYFFDFLTYYIRHFFKFKLRYKDKLIEESQKFFVSNFEFSKLTKKSLDVDKIKLVLMDDHHQKIFNSIGYYDIEKIKKELLSIDNSNKINDRRYWIIEDRLSFLMKIVMS